MHEQRRGRPRKTGRMMQVSERETSVMGIGRTDKAGTNVTNNWILCKFTMMMMMIHSRGTIKNIVIIDEFSIFKTEGKGRG